MTERAKQMNEKRRCDVCGQRTLEYVCKPYEYTLTHDGRGPFTIRIPDLEVIACRNSECRPEHPDDTIIIDEAATRRITVETYRQLGLLTPDEMRQKRLALGLTQQQLQRQLGLGGNTLSRWESGHVFQSRALDRFLRSFFGCHDVQTYLSDEGTAASNNAMASRTNRFPFVRRETIAAALFTPRAVLTAAA